MPENRCFTQEEDTLIRYLYDELKIKKWALVAKTMTEEYGMERNAKQCRDRLVCSHLDIDNFWTPSLQPSGPPRRRTSSTSCTRA